MTIINELLLTHVSNVEQRLNICYDDIMRIQAALTANNDILTRMK